jgi:hypothetical protein
MRETAGLSWEDVQADLAYSHAKMSRIEAAEVGVSVADCKSLARLYDADADTIERMGQVARQAKERGWWHAYADAMAEPLTSYLEAEDEASAIDQFAIDVIPGVLQTADYARALMGAWADLDPDRVASLVELRIQRQQRLNDGNLALWVIMDEAALRRTVGDQTIHRAQLKHLADMAAGNPGVTLQVLPFDHGSHAAMGNGFYVIHFEGYEPVAFTDTITGGLFFEDQDDVRQHRWTFDKLRATALDHRPSLGIVRRYMKDLG